MERKLRYASWVVIAGLVILAAWRLFLPQGSSAYVQKRDISREIVVYVAGAVEKPGLVHLAPDARLDDVLRQVRLLPEANLESMNPAEKLKDGQKINVPFKVVLLPSDPTLTGNPANSGGNSGNSNSNGNGNSGSNSVSSAPMSPGIPKASSAVGGGKININTAGVAELEKLAGVGPALAERIVQYRSEHGPFTVAEDLEKVSGIGPKTFEKMAAQVTVGP